MRSFCVQFRHLMKVAKRTRQNSTTAAEDIDHYITIADGPPSCGWIGGKSAAEVSPIEIVRCFEDAARAQVIRLIIQQILI